MLKLGMNQKFLRIYDLIKGDDLIIFFLYLSHQNKFLCETFFFLESKHMKRQHEHKFDPFEFEQKDVINWSWHNSVAPKNLLDPR